MDEDQVVDPQIEVETPAEESPAAAPTEEVEVEVEVETPAEEPEGEVEEPAVEEPSEEPKPSRRENLRIQQIIERARQGEYAPTPTQPQDTLDYAKALDADPETIKALEADRKLYAERQRTDVLKQVEAVQFRTALEIDAPKVETKYKQFDKDSDQFNPAVANAVNQWYLATAGYDAKTNTVSNPNVRYSDFVEGIMELADEMAGEKVAKTTKNIAKQAATTALRPDGSSAKALNLQKDPGSMTKEELDAKIKHDLRTLKTIR